MKIYDRIYDFVKEKNKGNIFRNGMHKTKRVQFILKLLKEYNIPYHLDQFELDNNTNAFNIILKGKSDKMVVAHHDIVNPLSDNANDNSCSVINAIAVKITRPDINVVLLDGEEYGGIGSRRVSKQIKEGKIFKDIKYVLNLELTGKGGENFFIGNYPGGLYDHIKSLFDCPIYNTPFNDSVIFRQYGIDSVVINPLPITDKKTNCIYKDNYLDTSLLWLCHSMSDSVDKISITDMEVFVENVVLKILE